MLTSAVFPRGLSPRELDVGVSLALGEQIRFGAAGYVDVTIRTQSMTAVPTMLVLQRVQFMTAIGFCRCATWASALDARTSKDHLARSC